MKKRIFWIILILALAGGGTWYLLSRNNTPKTYQFVKIEKGDLESTVSCTGTLQFLRTENVIAQISGTINKYYADYNQKVRKGQLLATLDTESLELSVEEADGSLDKANVELMQAQRTYDDTKDLYEKSFKSKTDLNTAEVALATAKIAVKSAQIAQKRAQLNLDYASITSPLSGMVIQRNAEIGQAVSAGNSASPLFIIASDISHMQTLASVDESDISKIKPNQEVRFTVQAYPDKTFTGKVSQVRLQSTTVQNVVNYTVAVDVYNEGGLLLPGMTATMDLVTEKTTNVYKVLNTALKFRAPQEFYQQMEKERTERENTSPGIESDSKTTSGERNPNQNKRDSNRSQGQRSNNQKNNSAILWTMDTNTGKAHAIRVRTGMTDGKMTQVMAREELEGMEIISGTAITTQKKSQTKTTSPFQPSGGGGRPHM